MQIRVTTTSADFITTELGTVESEDAIRLFNNQSWEKELERLDNSIRDQSTKYGNPTKEYSERIMEYCNPDMTFTALPSHLIALIKNANEFDVEVCLPRSTKLFGIFKRVKFYDYQSVSKQKVVEFIKIFCLDALDQKHILFSSKVNSAT